LSGFYLADLDSKNHRLNIKWNHEVVCMGIFMRKISENGINKEVYVYYMGRLIYKSWFVKGEKKASLVMQSSGLNFHRAAGTPEQEDICQSS
jgi:hypothetical protein